MALTSGSSSDPYHLDNPYLNGYYDVSGATQIVPATNAGLTTAVIVSFGQSLHGNNSSGSYSIFNTYNHNFCYLNGVVYRSRPRLLAAGDTKQQENFLARLADKIITGGGKQRIIICPMNVDGSVIADWQAGGAHNHRFGVMYRRLASVGLTPTHWICGLGESDALLATSQAAFSAGMTSVGTTISALMGTSAPIYWERCTWINGSSPAGGAAIRAAIAATVDGTYLKLGPDTDTLDNTNRQDTTHWNATGADASASLWKTSLGL